MQRLCATALFHSPNTALSSLSPKRPPAKTAMETVALNYREAGTGQPLILMHGMFGSLNNLGGIARLLSQHYRAIRVDARNHGNSPHHATMSYPAMAADVIRLLDDLEIPKAVLIGHSMGGKVMMQAAIDYPDRVDSLIVLDIAPVTYPATGHDNVLAGLNQLYQNPPATREDADKILEGFISSAGLRSFLLTNLIRADDNRLRLRLNMPSICENYQSQLTLGPSGPAYQGPTLFLRGSESPYIRERNRPAIEALFPNGELLSVEGAGHMLHAKQPDVVADHIRSFLESVSANG